MQRALIILLLLTGALNAMAIEEAPFQTELSEGSYSLRSYPPRIVAETRISGDMDQASSRGFRRLAGYIFGANRNSGGSAEKIAMTAPVIVQPETPASAIIRTAAAWRVQFVMPSQYRQLDLPKPLDSEVVLRSLPATRYAVVSFSGICWLSTVQARSDALSAWMQAHGLKPQGPALLMRYDPPWTLPFLRRNELLLEIDS